MSGVASAGPIDALLPDRAGWPPETTSWPGGRVGPWAAGYEQPGSIPITEQSRSGRHRPAPHRVERTLSSQHLPDTNADRPARPIPARASSPTIGEPYRLDRLKGPLASEPLHQLQQRIGLKSPSPARHRCRGVDPFASPPAAGPRRSPDGEFPQVSERRGRERPRSGQQVRSGQRRAADQQQHRLQAAGASHRVPLVQHFRAVHGLPRRTSRRSDCRTCRHRAGKAGSRAPVRPATGSTHRPAGSARLRGGRGRRQAAATHPGTPTFNSRSTSPVQASTRTSQVAPASAPGPGGGITIGWDSARWAPASVGVSRHYEGVKSGLRGG